MTTETPTADHIAELIAELGKAEAARIEAERTLASAGIREEAAKLELGRLLGLGKPARASRGAQASPDVQAREDSIRSLLVELRSADSATIRTRLGLETHTVHNTMKAMVRKGTAVRLDRGMYGPVAS